mgnify:CR=1 FL=1
MKKTKNGFLCRKCGNMIHTNTGVQSKKAKKIEHSILVYVVDSSKDKYEKVSQECPKCGNREASHWFSVVSGEHAGIRRERTIEHFKCTNGPPTGTKSS